MRLHVALRSLPALEAVRISDAARMIAFCRLDGHNPSVDIQIRHWRFPPPAYEAAYDGISLFGYWPAPTGAMPVGAKNDTDPF
jgi:hypothetical protein